MSQRGKRARGLLASPPAMRLDGWAAATMVLSLTACDPRATLTEAGLRRLTTTAGALELEVEPMGECPTFPRVTATQNGATLTQLEAGGLDRTRAVVGRVARVP